MSATSGLEGGLDNLNILYVEVQISFFPIKVPEADFIFSQFIPIQKPVVKSPAEPGMAEEGTAVGEMFAKFIGLIDRDIPFGRFEIDFADTEGAGFP